MMFLFLWADAVPCSRVQSTHAYPVHEFLPTKFNIPPSRPAGQTDQTLLNTSAPSSRPHSKQPVPPGGLPSIHIILPLPSWLYGPNPPPDSPTEPRAKPVISPTVQDGFRCHADCSAVSAYRCGD